MTRAQQAAELAKQLAALLGQSEPTPANDDEPAIDEEAIRALARADAEQMRRARRR